MKKRIISIFLIVSIITSIFAISAVNTSAAVIPSAPSLKAVLPLNSGQYINVNWKHDGTNTEKYCVWVANSKADLNRKGSWKQYYTTKKYYNISGLKPNTSYVIKVSALGKTKNGKHSGYSAMFTASTNPTITWCQTSYAGPDFGGRSQIGYNLLWSGTPNYYKIALFVNKIKYNRTNNTNHYQTGLYLGSQTVVCQVQAVFKVNNKEYTSGWSNPYTIHKGK